VRNIEHSEVFAACNLNDDDVIETSELRNFVEGLNADFQKRETFALL
jgi:hypothetical protein